VHDDPIEVLNNPTEPGSRVISISAPELPRGFNIIEIEFGAKGFPLGCRILCHRLSSRDGDLSAVDTRIALYPPWYGHLKVIGHDRLPRVLAMLPEQEIRFEDALEHIKGGGLILHRSTFADALCEGEWLGVLEITDRQEPHEYWRIRKVGR
jgi:hypothetical protein